MTIAIGARFDNGVVLCADTRIAASDGATTSGTKIHSLMTPVGVYAIADTSDDAHASTMLSKQIIAALGDESTTNAYNFEGPIKSTMQQWQSAYTGGVTPPDMHFIVALAVRGNHSVLFCKPPNTVINKYGVTSIGWGARVVDALIPNVFLSDMPSVETTLVRLAYLMYRAKKDEGATCGGETDTVVITRSPVKFAFIGRSEMAAAEALGADVDLLLREVRSGILNKNGEQEPRLLRISEKYRELAEKVGSIKFPSLQDLEGWED